ncbi:DUF6083 domain-containing protein [Streptomyces sp. SM10]|uniref:DUF6083 domain-containing protein n=1 Tax=Streptomyces sp. SM10 TaxID=565556 RepID=UPI000CD4A722|nr:DUF6083 domain-containing protein [Streptomyces sp. SM10]
MCPHPPPVACRWDGSPLGSRRHRSLRVSANSPSRLLRTGQTSRCRACGNRIEWYQRDNHRPVSLHPYEVATSTVPASCRWHLSGGIAYRHGDGSTWCRIPHAVLCPSRRTPTTRLTPRLAEARRQLAVRTRTLIDAGLFTPAAPASPHPPPQASTACAITRPVVQFLYTRYLAAHPLEAIRCVAQTRTRYRCPRPVLDTAAPTGTWTLRPAGPVHGQLALPDGLMALYDLTHLPYAEQLRWRAQRCTAHAGALGAADLALTQWQTFDPLIHHSHIRPRLPGAAPNGGCGARP